MQSRKAKIIWTKTDEAPMLSSYSILPIIQAYTQDTGISIECRDISLAGRILSCFPEKLDKSQQIKDELMALGEMTQDPEVNIIKLPNISASVPQLKAAIKELNSHGFDVPKYPDSPQNEEEKEIKNRYSKVLGSAVNPVLREGNSDRRAATVVKNYAKRHPHSMGTWSPDSKSHVSTMSRGDFFANEKSTTIDKATTARIEFIAEDGELTILKDQLPLETAEVVDTTFMSRKALDDFIDQQIVESKAQGVLFSLHLKATMMKVSDPKIFGHCVQVFYAPVLEKHEKTIKDLGINLNNGIGDLFSKLKTDTHITPHKRAEIEADIKTLYA
ncbi:MAG: NADP-dependent isocitrate dehydrogenase, partial [SAR324 cluster bacterium]|nr:NADP-dependent isocitrate dehydrogenase [SAR324 cluster bacterium]